MEEEKRALSWQQFVESGFDGRDYQLREKSRKDQRGNQKGFIYSP